MLIQIDNWYTTLQWLLRNDRQTFYVSAIMYELMGENMAVSAYRLGYRQIVITQNYREHI